MQRALSDTINEHLARGGQSRTDLVLAMGYYNIIKGLQRLGSWLTGQCAPAGDQADRLAAALGLSPVEVLELAKVDVQRRVEEQRFVFDAALDER